MNARGTNRTSRPAMARITEAAQADDISSGTDRTAVRTALAPSATTRGTICVPHRMVASSNLTRSCLRTRTSSMDVLDYYVGKKSDYWARALAERQTPRCQSGCRSLTRTARTYSSASKSRCFERQPSFLERAYRSWSVAGPVGGRVMA